MPLTPLTHARFNDITARVQRAASMAHVHDAMGDKNFSDDLRMLIDLWREVIRLRPELEPKAAVEPSPAANKRRP